jgi:hypothetical protein
MKKYLILMATAIILFSCKKENAGTIANNNPALSKSETLYPVGFNYSLFEVTGIKTVTNSLNTSALKDQIKYLRYFVYSGSTYPRIELVPVKQKTQKSTDPNFGKITDSLPAGEYSIFFVGAQAPGHVITERKYTNDISGHPIFYYNNSSIYDTFNKHVNLVISAPVNRSVVLARVTTNITIKFTDIMPSNATTVKVSFANFPLGADLLKNAGDPHAQWELGELYPTKTFSFPVNSSDKSKTGFTLSTLVWPFFYPTISIDCFGLNGELIAHKELSKVIPELHANTNYIFSGELFDDKSHFTVTVNDQWNPPVDVPFSLPPAVITN